MWVQPWTCRPTALPLPDQIQSTGPTSYKLDSAYLARWHLDVRRRYHRVVTTVYYLLMDRDPLFREVQRFRQPWLWALLGGSALLVLVVGPVSWVGLAIVGVVAGLLYSLRLQTEVRDDGIYLKMWPLHWSFRQISWSEIERYEAEQYGPLGEFGGWGIRWAPGKMAYNVRGNQGVRIERMNGRTVVVGSQSVEEFVGAIDEASQ